MYTAYAVLSRDGGLLTGHLQQNAHDGLKMPETDHNVMVGTMLAALVRACPSRTLQLGVRPAACAVAHSHLEHSHHRFGLAQTSLVTLVKVVS